MHFWVNKKIKQNVSVHFPGSSIIPVWELWQNNFLIIFSLKDSLERLINISQNWNRKGDKWMRLWFREWGQWNVIHFYRCHNNHLSIYKRLEMSLTYDPTKVNSRSIKNIAISWSRQTRSGWNCFGHFRGLMQIFWLKNFFQKTCMWKILKMWSNIWI